MDDEYPSEIKITGIKDCCCTLRKKSKFVLVKYVSGEAIAIKAINNRKIHE